jgi:Fe2+ transport system protein FeoA
VTENYTTRTTSPLEWTRIESSFSYRMMAQNPYRARFATQTEMVVYSKSDYSGRSLGVLPSWQPSGVRRLRVLSDLHIGESGVLIALDLPDSVQNHLMHMGFVPNARVTALRRAPAGDPTVYAIDGMEIALRVETAKAIRVRNLATSEIEKVKQELAEALR